MSSSLRFGSQVKHLASPSSSTMARQTPSSVAGVFDPLDDAYNLWSRDDGSSRAQPAFQWPTEEQAGSLLETFLDSIGTVQHLIDPRTFSDGLASLYENDLTHKQIITLFDVQALLVMAIGRLLRGSSSSSHDDLPGAEYFQKAMRHVPGLSHLRRAGLLSIEILALATFYLQCADCKEDAYVYVSPYKPTLPGKWQLMDHCLWYCRQG